MIIIIKIIIIIMIIIKIIIIIMLIKVLVIINISLNTVSWKNFCCYNISIFVFKKLLTF